MATGPATIPRGDSGGFDMAQRGRRRGFRVAMAAIALGSIAAVACTPPGGPTGPVDPAPFNHATKIAVLGVRRKVA